MHKFVQIRNLLSVKSLNMANVKVFLQSVVRGGVHSLQVVWRRIQAWKELALVSGNACGAMAVPVPEYLGLGPCCTSGLVSLLLCIRGSGGAVGDGPRTWYLPPLWEVLT